MIKKYPFKTKQRKEEAKFEIIMDAIVSIRRAKVLVDLANQKNKKLIIDPKNNFSKYKNGYMIKPNKKELSVATGIEINNKDDLLKAGWKLKKELNLKY